MEPFFTPPAVLGFLFLVWGASSYLLYRFGRVSAFAAGVARSMVCEPRLWDYDANQNWLISHKADIAVSVQSGNFGEVQTLKKPNSGTIIIEKFVSSDKRAFRRAYEQWCELTAVDRRLTAERRKADAIEALAA